MRLVISADSTDWNKGSLQLFSNHAVIACYPGGPAELSYTPNAMGLALQGAGQTAQAAGVAAVWEGDRHSYRVVTSARRFKKDIKPLAGGALTKVLALKPITFLSAIAGDTPARMVGFIAEDFVDAGLREFVTYQDGEVQTLMYDRVPALLVKAIQELTARVAQLESRA
jgi:hypothetical protein